MPSIFHALEFAHMHVVRLDCFHMLSQIEGHIIMRLN